MIGHSGQTISAWVATAQVPERSPLIEDMRTEVCIVGAGIAGLTTAYLLAQEGKKVVVLEDGHLGGGMTERTTAHLSNALDARFFELGRLHGERGAELAAQSHTAAIDQIEKIVREEGIECDFERLDGYLIAGADQPRAQINEQLERELLAAHRAGLLNVEQAVRAPIDSFDTGACLRFPQQAQMHPLRYLIGLVRAIERMGGIIFTGTHVSSITGGVLARVETTSGCEVTADAVVVATNTPINDLVAIHTKQAPYTTYVIGVRMPHGTVTKALYWDTEDPYHYIRVAPMQSNYGNYDLLIVGGEDHKSGQADDIEQRHSRLESWTRERFPMAGEVDFRWSGQVMESVDGLAFIGHNPGSEKNIYVATGDCGQGMTHGTIAGRLITDLIVGRESPWKTLYEPSRKTVSAPIEYAKENLNVAAQYVKDYLTGGDVNYVDEITPGEGAVIRHGLSKLAVYRDEQGSVYQCSAVCPHLGCIVKWNNLEKTWDCPCHGSSFDRFGQVINGPANTNLEPVKDIKNRELTKGA